MADANCINTSLIVLYSMGRRAVKRGEGCVAVAEVCARCKGTA